MSPFESVTRSLGPLAPNLAAAPSHGIHGELGLPLQAEPPSTSLSDSDGAPSPYDVVGRHHSADADTDALAAPREDAWSSPPPAGPAPSTSASHLSPLVEPSSHAVP